LALHLAPLVEKGLVASPVDVYEPSTSKGREIGVGLWSTALQPFRSSTRSSHQLLWQDLTHYYGHWVDRVGYRTPNGSWLAKSQLPTPTNIQDDDDDMGMPALLFLREMDLLTALRRAVHLEEMQGTVQIHHGNQARITQIHEDSPHSYSAGLVLGGGNDDDVVVTDRDYHLIVAADGMHSMLRKKYGGHRKLQKLTGTGALRRHSTDDTGTLSDTGSSWEALGQAEANAIEDRHYTVFRGNSDLSHTECGLEGESFQTWGVGKSMRFATVPLLYPSSKDKRRTEKEVWFITTSDDAIAAETDATKRRDLLLDAFRDWHAPICQMVEATPPEEILHERAVAHRHCMGPVLDVNRNLEQYHKKQPKSSGPGPAIVFIGDAFMTVDPILAQGFTMGMEGAHELATSVELGCKSGSSSAEDSSLAFDPYVLRKELLDRYNRRSHRLLCLLRATELVQALGQPSSGLVGSVSQNIIRPLMKLCPDFIKRPMFNAVLRYSLGLPPRKH
jgi:2-polyprenyl-6-methoxyphenol hydroxylase-like FAD-dependent oxidoreductase